jgi:hypothetical protein
VESGRPFVLEEEHKWLRSIAINELRDPVHFWAKMDALPKIPGKIPAKLRASLDHLMPEPGLDYRTVRRVAGLGSLGHVRVVAIAQCNGGRIAREAKALTPSSIQWADGKKGRGEIMYQTIVDRAVRDRDPFVQLHGSWVVRRLAPFCSRIEWARRTVSRHLDRLKPVQLLSAAKDMAKAVTKDWRAWKEAAES